MLTYTCMIIDSIKRDTQENWLLQVRDMGTRMRGRIISHCILFFIQM